MRFTDLFIKRPVLSCVISLLIFFIGLRCMQLLQLREFPEINQSVITVSTIYPGANAQLVKGFITNPLERVLASADGVEYLTATSVNGQSTITLNIKLGFDVNTAFTSVMSKVAQVRNMLPPQSEQPTIAKGTGRTIASMYLSFSSTQMSPEQITEFVSRTVQPELETVPGVSAADLLGQKTFAMRIWLNPDRMRSYGISAQEVSTALQQNNFQSAAGSTKGEYVAYSVRADTNLQTTDGFEQLVVKTVKGQAIRLKDIARVQLGSEDYDSSVIFDGKQSIFIGVSPAPDANPLTVLKAVRSRLASVSPQFPGDLKASVVYDSSVYIQAALHDVTKTIIEACVIVLLVIYLFLGSFRTVLIPLVTIPLSLVGVCSVLLLMGFTLNILTLLAMVLAIGMVVDDAIVVVENCYRHIELGQTPFQAAIQGTREIALPVVAMSITLAAVYAPIGFMQGLTGSLFKEFAFTLAGSVIISGVIALTLSPMMCARLLKPQQKSGKLSAWIDQRLNRLSQSYARRLESALSTRSVIVVMALILLASCVVFYMGAQHELAPSEDQNAVFMSSMAPEYANIHYVEGYTKQFDAIFRSYPEMAHYMILNGVGSVNNVIAAMMLKPWDERKRGQKIIARTLQQQIKKVPGMNTVVFPLPSLPSGGGGLPVQFVLQSSDNYADLFRLSQQVLMQLKNSGLFIFIDSSLKYNKPEVSLRIDRNKAGQLGIRMQEVGSALATALGGNYINRFDMSGQSYKVIPQVLPSYRFNPDELNKINVPAADGSMVPLSALVTYQNTVEPNKLEEFQQQNSVTLQGVPIPGTSMGSVVKYLQNLSHDLPKHVSTAFAGQSRDYVQQGDALLYTFIFALIVIYLVLAAQFESFRDPFIVLVSVPLSLSGALLFLYVGLASVNIYTQIGLLTLVGLISKHGILMVEFANQLQIDRGMNRFEAIVESAKVRLRPILMTTLSMVVGVIPLILATGAQAKCRFDIGLVIAAGMSIGTAFTLFVVPTMYTYMARAHQPDVTDAKQ